MSKMILFRWPWSQHVVDLPGAVLVDSCDRDGDPIEGMDSAYMVPETALEKAPYDEAFANADGIYIEVSFPDSQAHDEDEGVLYDYEGNCYVPVDE